MPAKPYISIIILSLTILLVSSSRHAHSSSDTQSQCNAFWDKTNQTYLNHVTYPVNAHDTYVVGLHLYSGYLDEQVIAHHFCASLQDDILQCVIYDSRDLHAKMMGTEYLISEELFKTLDSEERKLWHSHVYEVKSGVLAAPDMSPEEELNLVSKIIKMYGKTEHTWHHTKLPEGTPQLMMAFTDDSQVDWDLVRMQDAGMSTTYEERRERREGLEAPEVVDGADDWVKSGKAVRYVTEEVPMHY